MLKEKIVKHLGFDPDDLESCKNYFVYKQYGMLSQFSTYSTIDRINFCIDKIKIELIELDYTLIQYIKNPSEEIQMAIVKMKPYKIMDIVNPSIEVQKEAVRASEYQVETLLLCPNWREIRDEIENEMIIKDIIE